jgi:hypothetical protein
MARFRIASLRSTLCALSGLFILTGSALGDIFNYTLTSGTDTITIDGTTANGNVEFFAPDQDGGLAIQEGGKLLVNQVGPQLFTGTLADPTLEEFSNLKLTGFPDGNPAYDESFLLKRERNPGAWFLRSVGLGLSGLLATSRLRRAKRPE